MYTFWTLLETLNYSGFQVFLKIKIHKAWVSFYFICISLFPCTSSTLKDILQARKFRSRTCPRESLTGHRGAGADMDRRPPGGCTTFLPGQPCLKVIVEQKSRNSPIQQTINQPGNCSRHWEHNSEQNCQTFSEITELMQIQTLG